ncbi:MAG: class B sortase [Anaerolineaceae bacterium]|nr:class B sortase [Anaerolineaceae bacterium]
MIKKTALFIILLISISGSIAVGEKLFRALNEYEEGKKIYEEISEIAHVPSPTVTRQSTNSEITEIAVSPGTEENTQPVESKSSPIDFESLLKISSDIRGWIRLEGTRVDYPVMQSKDNDFYLSRAVNGTWNKVGTPFMDFRNNGDFSDRLTVIYGHYMGDGSMFTDIHNYKKQKFYEEHPYIDLYTPDGYYRISPVAGVFQNVEYWDFTFDYESDTAFLHQIDTWKALSTFRSDTEYAAEDRFVVLTLCTYDVENSRFLLVGKLKTLEETEQA